MVAVNEQVWFRGLSAPQRRLLRTMQDIGHGRIAFRIEGGQPDYRETWRVVRTVRLAGGDNTSRPELRVPDFELRKEHVTLLSQLSCLPDGTRVIVKVMHGLPGASIDIEQDYLMA